MLTNIFMIFGILSLIYFFMYAVFVDLTNKFTYFWLMAGLGCILLKILSKYSEVKQIAIPKGVKWTVAIVTIMLFLIFIVTESVIVAYGNSKPENGADYVLVLGAQVKGRNITYALQTRLDTAYEYLIDNPETIVILSGGKGPGEEVTEAYAMAEYLKKKGLDESRMLLEEQSRSTHENILYSKQLINNSKSSIVLVTNRFHVFRGVGVAKKQGLTNVEGLGSPTKWYTIPNQYVREAFAIIKYKLCGQI